MSPLVRRIVRWGLALLVAAAVLGGLMRTAAGAIGASAFTFGGGAASSASWSHTVASGSNRILVVSVTNINTAVSVSSVSYGGVALTSLGTAVNGSGGSRPRASMWYLVAPAVGTANVVVSLTGSTRVVAMGRTYTGVSQSNPFGTVASASGNNKAPSVTVSGAVGDMVIDVVSAQGTAGTSVTWGSGQTGDGVYTGTSSSDVIGLISYKDGASSVTMSAAYGVTAPWVSIGVALKAAPVALSGSVFEDVNYGGGAGRSFAASGGSGVTGARVELFDAGGNFVSATTTAAGGGYSFSVPSGSYTVRVVNSSVPSTRTGYNTSLRPVMTYRTNASAGTAAAVTDRIGGENPALIDAGNGSSTLAALATASTAAQSVTAVTAGSSDISGLDFGFNFNTVVNTGDSDQGSLRQAINNANALTGEASLAQVGRPAGQESLIFMISNGTSGSGGSLGLSGGLRAANNYFTTAAGGYNVATISPLSALPTISTSMIINAQAQPGWSLAPLIELNGAGAGSGVTGLSVWSASGVSIRGFSIRSFQSNGLGVADSSNCTVAGNYLGLTAAGTAAAGNGGDGLNLWNASNCVIGGTAASDRNVMSGNTNMGVVVNASNGAGGHTIRGNYIGTNAAGNAAVANGSQGLWIGAGTHTIGGTAAGAGNVISGNTYSGMSLSSSTSGNTLQGNFIGLNAAGTTGLPNGGVGINVTTGGNIIGGTAAAARNVISGNRGAGVSFNGSAATGNQLMGNYIGTDAAGTGAVGNGVATTVEGVAVSNGASNNSIGGTAAGAGNRIAYNGTAGVAVNTGTGNAILGNAIYGNVAAGGIDLFPWGVNVNDGGKDGTQTHLGMDSPVFTTASLSGTTLSVTGYVGSAAGQAAFAGARVEVFISDNDATGYGEGQTYLGALTSDANGRFSGALTGVSGLTVGTSRLTATATDGANNTSEFGANFRLLNLAISGTVFEDINYGGGAGRSLAGSGGAGVDGATVELYDAAGAYLSSATTAGGGAYSFGGLSSGSFFVRVVNDSVRSTRSGGTAAQIGVMSFRTTGSGGSAAPLTDQVGGTNPALADAAAAGAGASFNTSSFVFGAGPTGTAQSVSPVTLSSANLAGVDFGFNFSTIVNTNDSGQGSLRQFIVNANALGGKAALAQSGSRRTLTNAAGALPAARETSVFMISGGAAVPGLRAGLPNLLTSGVAQITLGTVLPQLVGASVNLDGSTQTANVGDTNAGTLGTGGTVGVDALALPLLYKPEVELTFTNLSTGISIGANDATVRALALRSTGSSALNGGAVALADAVTGAVIEGNLIGSRASALTDPGAGQYLGAGVVSNGADNANVRNNLFTYFKNTGIQLAGTLSANWVMEANEIRDGGLDFNNADGIAFTSAVNAIVRGNLMTGISTQALIFGTNAASNGLVINNTISGNGVGPSTAPTTQSGAVVARSGAVGWLIEANIVTANYGPGVAVNNGASGLALTRNAIFANGTIPSRNGTAATGHIDIDLNSATDDANLGTAPFYTVNDTGDADSGGNNLQNHPVLSSAFKSGAQLLLSGTLNSNANGNYRIEFFSTTAPNASGRGGGQTYLGFVNAATDASGDASFSTALTASTALGAQITATATRTDASYATLIETSEFSPNVVVSLPLTGTVFEDINYGGGAGRSLAASGGVGLAGARVELYDGTGTFVSATTTAAGGSYTLPAAASGAYTVRVVNSSVVSSRAGATGSLPGVQTYRTEAASGTATAIADQVGGLRPEAVDAPAGSNGTSLWTQCATENATCTFSGTRIVRYGAYASSSSRWTTRVLTGGTACSNGVFGDPYSGIAKVCQLLNDNTQSLSNVAVGSASVSGVDFGFNFDSVVNTNDAAQGSLRQAITNANTLGGDAALAQAGRTAAIENLVFMISNGTAAAGLRSSNNLFSGGVASVGLASALPAISAPLVLDAQTQPGWVLAPLIELNGTAAGGASPGLALNAAGSVVRGLVINRFGAEGIVSTAGASLVIQGNYLGLNAAGVSAAGNGGAGIRINSSAGAHQVGGTTASQRNVISGNAALDGVIISGGAGSAIQGNYIGLNAAGTALLANGRDGVRLDGTSQGTTVGGTAAGAGNVIAGNAGRGINVFSASASNALLGNSIYGNGSLGIDLANDGATANDGAKTTGQANLHMDSPVISSARARGPQLTVAGYVGTAAGQSVFAGSRVEVFVSDASSASGSGRTYLGALTADASGNFSGTVTMPVTALRAGSVLTGTATDSGNNTSEFGANFSGLVVDWLINNNGDGVDANPGDGLCETSTAGQCTLRAAIMEANAWAGADIALFDLPSCPGAGCIITPASSLPAITGQLTLDGQTQPGWTLAPLVDLRGEVAGGSSNGLDITAAGSIVRGLAIGGFLQSGISINANNVTVEGVYAGIAPDGSTARANGAVDSATGGIYLAGGTGVVIGGTAAAQRNVLSGNGGAGLWLNGGTATVSGNFIGTNAAGSAAVRNRRWGVHISSGTGHQIGGSTAGQGNVISGNSGGATGGIIVAASGVTIQGNTIGLNAARTAAIANGNGTTTYDSGIDLRSGSGHLIGGTGAGEGNVIAGNQGHGVRVASQTTRILGNSLYNNLWLGIDLGADGVTANNGTQSGSLPNNDMDHPVITSAGYDPLTRALTLTGYVGTGTGQSLFAGARIELFTSDGDASGYGEGNAYVGTLTVDGSGRFSGTVSVPAGVSFAIGTALTGTATSTSNNTSEFGPNYVTTSMAALAPSRFNAFESSTAAGALTGVIQTRVAGVPGSIAVIAIDNAGTALQTSFAGTVTLEWMNAANNSGALDAGNCRASWVAAGSAGSVPFVSGDQGRRDATITPATVGREWRLRMSYTGPSGTVTSCSTDAFAVRPSSLAITGVSDADAATAGTTRLLDNLAASGGRVHRAGRPFSLRAAARDAASAVATGYDGVPGLALTSCVLPSSGCVPGALTAPALVASSGVIASDSLSYSEVGAINLQLTDDSFADIDAADTPLAQRRIQSSVLGVGRFVPDQYLLTAANAPQFATQQGTCAAAGQGFTFVGQNFGWATAPRFTITAQNAAGGTTALWSGVLQKVDPAAHVVRSLSASNAQGLTPAVTWGAMSLTDAGGGVASVSLAGDQFLFGRNAAAPVPSFDPLISLSLSVSDASESPVVGNGSVASGATLVVGGGTGIAFNLGSRFHYARLKLQNAFGDARRGVSANLELQKFTDRGWLRLSEDNTCISVPQSSIAFSAGSGAFATDLCTAPPSAGVALRQGRGTLVLPKTAGNLQGAAVLTLNIGPTLEGNACASGVPVAPTSAAWPHLLGSRGTGATQDQNPSARLVWGRQHRDFMVQRELF